MHNSKQQMTLNTKFSVVNSFQLHSTPLNQFRTLDAVSMSQIIKLKGRKKLCFPLPSRRVYIDTPNPLGHVCDSIRPIFFSKTNLPPPPPKKNISLTSSPCATCHNRCTKTRNMTCGVAKWQQVATSGG